MIHKNLAAIAVAIASCTSSMATISVILQADLLENESGVPIPDNSLVMLIVDTSGDGFEPLFPGSSTLVNGNPLTPGGNDYVVYRSDVSSGGAYSPGVLDRALSGANALNLATIPGSLWNPGDRLALVWFTGGTTGLTFSSTTIAPNSRYGLYSNPLAVDGSRAWTTPADPSNNNFLLFYTKDGSGNNLSPGSSASNLGVAGRANQIAVPEPTTLGMAALAVIGLLSRRRRN